MVGFQHDVRTPFRMGDSDWPQVNQAESLSMIRFSSYNF